MGFFDYDLFDFNRDGETDMVETMIGLQMLASSREEAIELTGDDTFYDGSDEYEDDDFDEDDFDSDDFDSDWE